MFVVCPWMRSDISRSVFSSFRGAANGHAQTHKHTNASPSPRAIKYKLIPFCASKLPWPHTAGHFKRMLRPMQTKAPAHHRTDDVSKHGRNRWRAKRGNFAETAARINSTRWQLPCIFQAADSLSRGKKKKKKVLSRWVSVATTQVNPGLPAAPPTPSAQMALGRQWQGGVRCESGWRGDEVTPGSASQC